MYTTTGAPYSTIGVIELNFLAEQLNVKTFLEMGPVPSALNGHGHWRYGTGQHSSPIRKFLGSIVLNATADSGRTVEITHWLLESSSQWVIGRKVTRKANLEHIGTNAIMFFVHGNSESISLTDHAFLTYIKLKSFVNSPDESYSNCSNVNILSDHLQNQNWSEVKKNTDKVHKHVCGHANYTDF